MELLNFLSPKSTLDLIFFIAIICCFIITTFAAVMVKKALSGLLQNQPLPLPFTDEATIRHYLTNPKWDSIVENGAGFALIIGLLGTFIGIGLAIQDASKVIISLNDSLKDSSTASSSNIVSSVGRLSPVLSDIGTKFKVSAWGIICHILIRLSIPFFKIEAFIKKYITENLNEINTRKEKIKESYDTKIMGFLLQSQITNKDILQEIKKVANIPYQIENSLKSFTSSVESYNVSSTESIDSLVIIVQSLKADLDEILSDINQSVENIDLKSNESFTELNNLTRHVFTDSMKNLIETNEQAIDLVQNIEKLLTTDKLIGLTGNIHTMNDNLETLEETLATMQSLISITSKPISQALPIVGNFLQSNLDLSQRLTDNLATKEDFSKALNNNLILMQKINSNLLRLNMDRQIKLGD